MIPDDRREGAAFPLDETEESRRADAIRGDATRAARRWCEQVGTDVEIVSVMELLSPDDIPHFAVAVRATWHSAGFQRRTRVLILFRSGTTWWTLQISEIWMQEMARLMRAEY